MSLVTAWQAGCIVCWVLWRMLWIVASLFATTKGQRYVRVGLRGREVGRAVVFFLLRVALRHDTSESADYVR